MKWLVAVAVLAGCSRVTSTGDGTPGDATEWTIRVTVARHPAVHEVASIAITRTADGISAVETIQITDAEFPVTYEFEVDSPQTATIETIVPSGEASAGLMLKKMAPPVVTGHAEMIEGAPREVAARIVDILKGRGLA